MDYLELLFADRVRSIALDFYKGARAAARDALRQQGIDDPDMAEWEKANPLANYLKDAYEDIAFTAEKIRTFQGLTDKPANT